MKSESHTGSSREPGRAAYTDAQASEFIIRRYDREGWTGTDETELKGWLAESSANRTAFLRLKSTWMRANRLDALRPMAMNDGSASAQSPFQPRLKLAAAAAAITLVALLTGTGLFAGRATTKTFSTKIGEQSHLQLPDGTRIELTTDTVLRIAANGNIRKAWLDQGEAFFHVVHDEKHPFELQALNFRIVDLGTEFSVRRDDDRIRVTVLSGSVRVAAPNTKDGNGTVRLTAGEVAIADNNSIRVMRKAESEIADSLSWRDGVLVFRNAPLSDVAAEFNRYNTDKIVIDGPRVADMNVSARLRASDVTAFARMAHDFMGLTIQRNGDEIHISRQRK